MPYIIFRTKFMNYWLVKSEPESYSLENFQEQKIAVWDGVRNYTARNNIRAMAQGDTCIFYRSVEKPAVIALCRVVRESFQDPTTDNPAWLSVELELTEIFKKEMSLTEVKNHPALQNMILLKISRLSVQPVTPEEFDFICAYCR